MNTSITRRSLLAGALAAGVTTVTGAGSAVAVAPDYGSGHLGDWTSLTASVSTADTIARANVWMLGDSIAARCQYDLAVRLSNERGQTLAVDDHAGRPTTPTLDVLEQWVSTYPLPRQLIMATGSNDVFDPTVMAGQLDRCMAIVAGRSEVYWVDVQVQRWSQPVATQIADQRNSGWVNMQIHDAAGRYGNLHTIGWATALASKPTRLPEYLSDGVHPNSTGVAYRNALTLQQMPAL